MGWSTAWCGIMNGEASICKGLKNTMNEFPFSPDGSVKSENLFKVIAFTFISIEVALIFNLTLILGFNLFKV